jgi:hypothetical protein
MQISPLLSALHCTQYEAPDSNSLSAKSALAELSARSRFDNPYRTLKNELVMWAISFCVLNFLAEEMR